MYGDKYLDANICDRVNCTNAWTLFTFIEQPNPEHPEFTALFCYYLCQECFDNEPFAHAYDEEGIEPVMGGSARLTESRFTNDTDGQESA